MPQLYFLLFFQVKPKNHLTKSIFLAKIFILLVVLHCAPKVRSCYCMYVVYAFFYSSFVNICVFVRPFQKLCSKGYCPLSTVSQDFVQKIRSAGSLIWEPPCMPIMFSVVFQSFIKKSRGSFQVVVRQSSGSLQVVIRLPSGSLRQLSISHQIVRFVIYFTAYGPESLI